ncbi:MAG: BON domain-containing protein [Myxococcales bacterium]|nr:BON domain-containing protein [Myxococcales bacterium]
MDEITRDVRSALYEAIGVRCEDIELRETDGKVVVGGVVDDLATRDRVLQVVRTASGRPVEDDLQVGADWGEEAQPKETEFGNEADARAMTSSDFQRID